MSAALGFDQQTGYGYQAAGSARVQTGPFPLFDCFTKGSFEGIDAGHSNPTQMNIVRRPDQYDARNRLSARPKFRKCRAWPS
jgi:hypothetical protein